MTRFTIVLGVLLASCGDDSQPGNNSPDARNPDAPQMMPDAATADGAVVDCTGTDIAAALAMLPGISQIAEGTTSTTGYRFFTMVIDQPVDHQNPAGAHFAQRITLMHRDCAAPVIVYNSGYSVSTRSGRTELTRLTSGNQISMEHRFFGTSVPNPPDWSTLVIEQAAADQHNVIQTFKALYHGKYLTTGASKGGMTSVFHRRFWPGDVDGTVAYVAPIDYAEDAVMSPTNRYFVFLENVGTDANCRQALKDFQRTLLSRRSAMIAQMNAYAQGMGDSFGNPLSVDKTFEFAAAEMPFIFWQYGSQTNCASIPASTATDDAVFQFFSTQATLSEWTDSAMAYFLAYYFQSGNQLGYPADDESYLSDLISYPGQDQPPAYLPSNVPVPTYSDAAMHDVQNWVSTQGSQILLIYGQNDPWSSGAIEIGNATDSFRFFVPGGNHGSNVSMLAAGDKAMALDAISRWSGVTVTSAIRALQTVDAEPGPEADLPRRFR